MADSDLWRDLANDFKGIDDPFNLLEAIWIEEQLGFTKWQLYTGSDRPGAYSARVEFESIARRAGSQVDPSEDSLDCWLRLLRRESPNVRPSHLVEQTGDTDPQHHDAGRIIALCRASTDLCKVLESRALEAERLAKIEQERKKDPKQWPYMVQQWEAHKSIKKTFAGPHEQIPEELLRALLSVQYGGRPEDVTFKQIQSALAELAGHYPSVEIVPSAPKHPSLARHESILISPGSAIVEHWDIPIPELATQPKPERDQSVAIPNTPRSTAEERTLLLNAYKREGKERGVRITDLMIAQAASTKWNERTPVQRWKRNDPRCTAGDDAKIRGVLQKKPHLRP